MAALAAALAAPSAKADDPAAAALIEQGLDLRQAQRDAEALALFEKAQALAPSPRGQAQVALAQQALGRWGLAEQNLRAALGAKDDAWIETRRPILERAMSVIQGHLGDVELVGATTGSVYVDSVAIKEPDALSHLRLEIGRRTLEVRAPGAYPFSRILDVLPGGVVRVEVEQHALLDDGVSPAGASGPVRVVVASEPGRVQRTFGWVVLGAAGIFVATGVVGLIERSVAVGDFNGNTACTTQKSNALSSQCSGWLDNGNTGQTLAVAGFVGAGVSGALSAVLLLTAPSSKPKATALTLPCSPTPGGAWCALRGTF